MSEPKNTIQTYRGKQGTKDQDVKVWALSAVIVFVWLGFIIVAPLLAAGGETVAASSIYHFFGFICHQMPDRSFFLDGHKLAVCSRCFGVYSGLLAGFAAYPLWRSIDNIEPLPRFWLLASMVPIGVDWSLTIFGIWENTFLTRFITGAILGVACATYIIPALIEIARNLKRVRAEAGP